MGVEEAMALRITFPDKYRLWTELVRGNTDRLFVRTDDTPRMGATVRLDVELPDLVLPIAVEGVIVGRRTESERFEAGVYLRFAEGEIEKCRRVLGLANLSDYHRRARKARRVHCELMVQFTMPKLPPPCATRNLSESGLLVTAPSQLVRGQRVEMTIRLDDDSELTVQAEVMWTSGERPLAGLRFVDLPEASLEALRAAVKRLHEAEQKKRGSGGPIVVADDDPDILNFISKSLSRYEYEVYQCLVGDEALGLVRELQPRAVLLDVLMPGIDGSDICRLMRADEELVDIPVIFLSALDERRLHAVADEAGATDYLAKPVDVAELINMVGRYLKH